MDGVRTSPRADSFVVAYRLSPAEVQELVCINRFLLATFDKDYQARCRRSVQALAGPFPRSTFRARVMVAFSAVLSAIR